MSNTPPCLWRQVPSKLRPQFREYLAYLVSKGYSWKESDSRGTIVLVVGFRKVWCFYLSVYSFYFIFVLFFRVDLYCLIFWLVLDWAPVSRSIGILLFIPCSPDIVLYFFSCFSFRLLFMFGLAKQTSLFSREEIQVLSFVPLATVAFSTAPVAPHIMLNSLQQLSACHIFMNYRSEVTEDDIFLIDGFLYRRAAQRRSHPPPQLEMWKSPALS